MSWRTGTDAQSPTDDPESRPLARPIREAQTKIDMPEPMKTVRFEYVISLVVATKHAYSDPIVLRSGQWAWLAAWPYQLTTLLLGWWGLPWGPVCSLVAVWNNLNGGELLDPSPEAADSIEVPV